MTTKSFCPARHKGKLPSKVCARVSTCFTKVLVSLPCTVLLGKNDGNHTAGLQFYVLMWPGFQRLTIGAKSGTDLLLTQSAHGVNPACATGRYKTGNQCGC